MEFLPINQRKMNAQGWKRCVLYMSSAIRRIEEKG